MINTKKIITGFTVSAVIFLSACQPADRWNPDVSKIKANVKFIRLEKELFSMDTANYPLAVQKIVTAHRDIMELFMMQVHNWGPLNQPRTWAIFKKVYLTNSYMRDSLYKDVEKAYPEPVIQELENQFTDAFRHMKYYYPLDSVPEVYTIINPFVIKAYTYKNNLAIALEMFLGADYRYYPSLNPPIPAYEAKNMRKEYILPEGLKTLFQDRYDEQKQVDQTLLSNMIYAGKRLFYSHAMKPDLNDTLLTGYSEKQLKWCRDYEKDIWDHLVTKNLLFSTNSDKVRRYLEEGPFTNDEDFPQESAPRVGEWTGWQIIKKYMKENPKITLDEMCKDKDYRKILSESKYKPGN